MLPEIPERHRSPENVCPDGCPPCECGSGDVRCLCWCDHASACTHPILSRPAALDVLVLGKRDKYGIGSKTFTNRTQAENAKTAYEKAGHGPAWVIRPNRIFYVRVG